MPITGLVIRLLPTSGPDADALASSLSSIPGLELGARAPHGLSAVLEAPDYARHDASLSALRDLPGVGSVDVVFHDFSDVSEFEPLPRRARGEQR